MTGMDRPLTADEFTRRLAALLEQADRSGVAFDRSWTVTAASGTDLMVEITHVDAQKPSVDE